MAADEDHGWHSLLALGHQDTDPLDLTAPPGLRIIGASSDHLVLASEQRLELGAELEFRPGYSALGARHELTDDALGHSAAVRTPAEAPGVEVVAPRLDAAILDLEDAARPQLGELTVERHVVQSLVHDGSIVGDLEQDLVRSARDIGELLRELADAVLADRRREWSVVPHRVLGARRNELVDVALLPQEQELADEGVVRVHHRAPVVRAHTLPSGGWRRDDEPTRIS